MPYRKFEIIDRHNGNVLASFGTETDESLGNINELQNHYFIEVGILPSDLAKLRRYERHRVGVKAGEVRSRYTPTEPGVDLFYITQIMEADDYLANGGVPADFPLLVAEGTARGFTTLTQAANYVKTRQDNWKTNIAPIEEARVTGFVNIAAATTADDIIDAANEAISALDDIGKDRVFL